MTLVIGATGLLGMEICRRLSGVGRPPRALVRRSADAGKRADLERLKVELVDGDLKDPASLQRACAGMRSVISTASSTLSRQEGDSIKTVDDEGQMALVNAARQSVVEHFVLLSFRDNPRIQYPLTQAKRAVERRLMESGMAYTILQASYFMEVWLSPALGFDWANGKVRVYGEGNNKLSWVSYKDVARVAVATLDEPRARNAVLEVGGPQALSPRDVVTMFEAAGAAEISTEHVPEAALRLQLDAASDPLEKSFAGLMLQYASGDAMESTQTRKMFPFPMTSVRDYVAASLAR